MVRGLGQDTENESDEPQHVVVLGKRIREIVDYCLEVDVGLEKRQKLDDEAV